MDFFRISTKEARGGVTEVFPDLRVGRHNDFMVRGQSFYAIWDETQQMWLTDEYEVARIVDAELDAHAAKLTEGGAECKVKHYGSNNTNGWSQFRKFMKNIGDNSKQLDAKLTFQNTVVKRSDYVSKRLPYPLEAGSHDVWDEILDVLYDPEERAKLEWAIGAVVSGDSKDIEKFMVLYGAPGSGKGTLLKMIEKLFVGYTTTFEASALVGNNSNFATEAFKDNPLVAIQHDGDLSKIVDNTKLNSIVGHDPMRLNEKFKPSYTTRLNSFLFLGTNYPVRIADANSGIIRRLIDVRPSGRKMEPDRYYALVKRIDFELGAIAQHCLDVYKSMGKNFYNKYTPIAMMFETDQFFNFVDFHYDIFAEQDGVTLTQAWKMYKEYREYAQIEHGMHLNKFREQLKNYFETFEERPRLGENRPRNLYSGFTGNQYKLPVASDPDKFTLALDENESPFDLAYSDYPAQYTNAAENPKLYWDDTERLIRGTVRKPDPSQICSTVLAEVDTSKLHYVKVPVDHIVIDFDLKGEDGNKSLELSLEAASQWPPTYAEISRSGDGVHLHYIYTGDPTDLAAEYLPGIEIKVYKGNSALRRKLTKCNSLPVAKISSGLPFKENNKVLDQKTVQTERGIRDLIFRNLQKEFHPGTKPSIDFIDTILRNAYLDGVAYDVTDLRPRIIKFASDSSNRALECLRIVQQMKWKNDESMKEHVQESSDAPIVIFDVEVFPNFFGICWKYRGAADSDVVKMINPTPAEVEQLFTFKLAGFNNRFYDNHMLWARSMGATNKQLYELSQRIIVQKDRSAFYGEAYGLSWTDVKDFAMVKMSLKKWEVELGIHHNEFNHPWTEPLPEDRWFECMDYCADDVNATDKVFDARIQDYVARQILADLSGKTVNDPTRVHMEHIVFGKDRNPQRLFNKPDLNERFPGYRFDPFVKVGKSSYRGEDPGEGGYVYAEPGMYENVALLDIASMHPTTIGVLNLFGDYTENYTALKNARLAINENRYDDARKMLDGRLAPYLENEEDAEALAYALKIALNSVYGLTSAKFSNRFLDPKNIDNVVAKYGALFMIDLKHKVQEAGFQVIHIKTDSIKIPNATPGIIDFVQNFGRDYGFDFKLEATYEKLCLVNEAVYVAFEGDSVKKGKNVPGHWTATGKQYQVPYVFKSLFTKEPITFTDLCVPQSVTGDSILYLDFDAVQKPTHNYTGMQFVGKTGLFVPVLESAGGGLLKRVKGDKEYAVSGTKNGNSHYFFVEAEVLKGRVDRAIIEGTPEFEEDTVDMSYFGRLVDEARENIGKYGDFNEFVSVGTGVPVPVPSILENDYAEVA